jgi:hypothetical protein
MIRFINCMRRRAELTAEDFRRYWLDPRFDALVGRVVALTGAVRHARSAALIVEANVMVMEERGSREPYDGVLEYWWESAGHLMRLSQTAEYAALRREMLAFQGQFVDFAASTAFFTEA